MIMSFFFFLFPYECECSHPKTDKERELDEWMEKKLAEIEIEKNRNPFDLPYEERESGVLCSGCGKRVSCTVNDKCEKCYYKPVKKKQWFKFWGNE